MEMKGKRNKASVFSFFYTIEKSFKNLTLISLIFVKTNYNPEYIKKNGKNQGEIFLVLDWDFFVFLRIFLK